MLPCVLQHTHVDVCCRVSYSVMQRMLLRIAPEIHRCSIGLFAVHCSVLQCPLQCVAECVAAFCSVLQRVAPEIHHCGVEGQYPLGNILKSQLHSHFTYSRLNIVN